MSQFANVAATIICAAAIISVTLLIARFDKTTPTNQNKKENQL